MKNLLAAIEVDLDNVNFIEGGRIDFRISDWRKEVPKEIQNNWNELTTQEKKLVYIMAQELNHIYFEYIYVDSRSYLE
jgi:hypothetical protein